MPSAAIGIMGYCTSILHTFAGTSTLEASSLGSANRCSSVSAARGPLTIRCSCLGSKPRDCCCCCYTYEVVTRKQSSHLAGVGNLTFIRKWVKTICFIEAFIIANSSWLRTMPSFMGSGEATATTLTVSVLITIATV